MSEYQRYEFMTSDRPLTRAELAASKAMKAKLEREQREQEQLARPSASSARCPQSAGGLLASN